MGGHLSAAARKRRDLEATAHHEAGHAVAAIWHDLGFRYVTINPDQAEGSLGHLLYQPPPKGFNPEVELTPKTRDRIERQIVAAFAGGHAEARFRGRHNLVGARRDRSQAIDLACYVAGYGRALEKYLDWLWTRSAEFVGSDPRWSEITKVARALLDHRRGRLTKMEVREILFGPPWRGPGTRIPPLDV